MAERWKRLGIVRMKKQPEAGPYLILNEDIPLIPTSGWKYTLVSLDGSKEIIKSVNAKNLIQGNYDLDFDLDWAFGLVVARMLSSKSSATGVAALSGRTKLYLFQLRPLLKFLRSEDRRLLIADEVGLGKTIEACYILVEEMNRSPIGRIVIVCPSHLVSKWRWELYSKFGLGFAPGRFRNLVRFLDNPAAVDSLVVSLDCANTSEKQKQLHEILAKGAKIDFLIVDEVHHCIGRQSDTFRRDLAISLSSISERVVALSASPVQIDKLDLKRVYDVLFPGRLSSEDFASMLNIAEILNRIQLNLAREEWTETTVQRIIDDTEKLRKAVPESHAVQSLASRLASLEVRASAIKKLELKDEVWAINPLASFMTRTRKKEVGQDRKRIVEDIAIELNETDSELIFVDGVEVAVSEKSLFNQLAALFKQSFSHVHVRQLSSSMKAIAGLLESGMDGYSVWRIGGRICLPPEYYDDDIRPRIQEEHISLSHKEQEQCNHLLFLLYQLNHDTKWRRLVHKLRELREEKPDRKVVVFTQWIPTLNYFMSKQNTSDLSDMTAYTLTMSKTSPFLRDRVLKQFRSSEGFSVLFSSDVLSEGIDIYEADTIINYDFPYNPQRLEQRIGRIDRIGQESPEIRIVNIFVKDSLDEEILSFLRTRIGYFQETIGEMGVILESDAEEWDSIDETEAVRIKRRMDALRQIEESGSLRVLDDLLDSEALTIAKSVDGLPLNLRWLPIVSFLRLFGAKRLTSQVPDVNGILIDGVNQTIIGLINLALDPLDGRMVEEALSASTEDSVLKLATSVSEYGFFPHLRSAFMSFIFEVINEVSNIDENASIQITFDSGHPRENSYSEIVLVSFVSNFEGTIEHHWEWWGLTHEGVWSSIELDLIEFYRASRCVGNDVSRVMERPVGFLEALSHQFSQWREDNMKKKVALKKMQLQAQRRRIQGHRFYLEIMLAEADNVSLMQAIKEEVNVLDRLWEQVDLKIASYHSCDSPCDYYAKHKIELRVVFNSE